MKRSHNGKIIEPNRYIILSSAFIKNNWKSIKEDLFNNQPDIDSPEEYIKAAKAGKVTAGGAKVIIQNEMPRP